MEKVSTEDFLRSRGYLTLNQLVEYLAEFHPLVAQSYPSLKRNVIDKGLLDCIEVGKQKRFTAESIERYIKSVEGAVTPSHTPQPNNSDTNGTNDENGTSHERINL